MKKSLRRNILLSVILFCLISLELQAQVVIGAVKSPEPFSVLELVSEYSAGDYGGLRLPRMTTTQRDDNLTPQLKSLQTTADKEAAKGLTVYNTTTECIDCWNGSGWVSICGLLTPPDGRKISFAPTYNTYNDDERLLFTGAVFVKGTGDDKTRGTGVTYTNMDAGYFYYHDAIGETLPEMLFPHESGLTVKIAAQTLNGSAAAPADGHIAIIVSGTPSSVYAGKAFDIPVEVLGHYLTVRVNTGCGAYTSNHQLSTDDNGVVRDWLQFQCFNLGADTSLDPFTWKSDGDRIGFDIKGDLYQWGRKKDGHQDRNSPVKGSAVPLSDLESDGQLKDASSYFGHFIQISGQGNWSEQNSPNLWGDGTADADQAKSDYDPCPDGWKMPSGKQLASLFSISDDYVGYPGIPTYSAISNKWVWDGSVNYGCMVGDALYLPYTGHRYSDYKLVGGLPKYTDQLKYVTVQSMYWTTSVVSAYGDSGSTLSHDLYVNSGMLISNTIGRNTGCAVRCIAE